MENNASSPTPPGCFLLEELETFQSLEGLTLDDVAYYVWLNRVEGDTANARFLYALELVFNSGGSLLLSSGEDSEAIRIISAEQLVETAGKLQQLHGEPVIRRIIADAQPLWHDLTGKTLQGIRVSRNETGLYLNDALLLDFGGINILVHLDKHEGLNLFREQ